MVGGWSKYNKINHRKEVNQNNNNKQENIKKRGQPVLDPHFSEPI